MMDKETWFNAKKAVELGFADKILFAKDDPKEEEDDDPKEPEEGDKGKEEDDDEKKKKLPFQTDSMMFSSQSVRNSFLSKPM